MNPDEATSLKQLFLSMLPKDGGISECANEGGAVGAAPPAQEKALCAVSCGVKGGVLSPRLIQMRLAQLRGALGPDHRDPGGRPGEVQVGGELLGAHHRIRPAVGLADVADFDERHGLVSRNPINRRRACASGRAR